MARVRRAALSAVAFAVLSCNNVTMLDGWSIGTPTTSDDRCDQAGVAQKAFHKAYPGETGSRMQLYDAGSYVASNGRLVGVPHTGRLVVAVFSLENGRRVALGIICSIGIAGAINPPDQSLIDQSAAAAEAYEHRTPRPTE
jgi:hypothetical protein